MRKYLLCLFGLLVTLSACVINDTKHSNEIVTNKSLLLAEQKGMRQLYDSTKWSLYCILCDRQVDFLPNLGIKEIVTFGMLPLREDTIIFRGDTVSSPKNRTV